jgi:hypothetical protein
MLNYTVEHVLLAPLALEVPDYTGLKRDWEKAQKTYEKQVTRFPTIKKSSHRVKVKL